MTFEEFQRHLLECRNPRKPAACLLILWLGYADGEIDPRQWQAAHKILSANSTDLELYRDLAARVNPRALQLSCEIIRAAPPWAQLAVLTTAIRVATANEELSLEENLVLRFLCSAFDERHDLDELFPMETGHALPGLPGGGDWWISKVKSEKRRKSIVASLSLIGRLRCELSLPGWSWWDEAMEAEFGVSQRKGQEFPQLTKVRGQRKWRGRLFIGGLAASLVLALGFLIVARIPRFHWWRNI